VQNEGPETVASVILEPINNTGGELTPPPEYFKILREICDRFNILLIFDEIVTGFGRLGKFFGADVFNVNPDILVMGKGMGGGYIAVAAIAFNDIIKEAFWGSEEIAFAHGHTYSGNPLACAASIACIKELIERKLPENAANMGNHIQKRLTRLRDYGILGEIRGKGLLLGAEFVADPETKKPFTDVHIAKEIAKVAQEKGLIMLPRTDPDLITFAPPLIVTNRDVDLMLDIFFESVEKVVEKIKK
jgi:adenosylmethionine-8-amino-7-oxononanoate aminotransferase